MSSNEIPFQIPNTSDERLGEMPGPEAYPTMFLRPKQKRKFSNRTKTGCLTCRRRKKKCDEVHPECNMCIKGRYVCEGYTLPKKAENLPSYKDLVSELSRVEELVKLPALRSKISEREKMLRGEYYLPYNLALVSDRERCAAAVWRFNNSVNPEARITREERFTLFKAILSLRPLEEAIYSDPAIIQGGSVGPGVAVEIPFHCDYGYNITIGSDVIIGPSCHITDSCAVTIGNNVVFGSGVRLICTTDHNDPQERRAGKGRALGRAITIEDNSYIGSHVTILPGVKVGYASTVSTGSLILKDVPPHSVVGNHVWNGFDSYQQVCNHQEGYWN